MAKSKAARRSAREERLAAIRAQQRRAERRRKTLAVVAVVVIIGAVGGVLAAIQVNGGSSSSTAFTGPIGGEGIPLQQGTPLVAPAPNAAGKPVDGITCGAEQLAYHIHSHLGIFVNGKLRPVPQGVGLGAQQTCFYWLHTHYADGIVHVESPTQKTYTLGNFFDIWGQPLGRSQVGPAKGAVTAYVNGKKYSGDPRSIALSPHALIQLDVGTPVVAPKTINWVGTQL